MRVAFRPGVHVGSGSPDEPAMTDAADCTEIIVDVGRDHRVRFRLRDDGHGGLRIESDGRHLSIEPFTPRHVTIKQSR